MRKLTYTAFLLVICALFSFYMDKPAYRFFTAEGKATDYEALLKEAQKADIVFFGELHNNPICHWLQLELTKDMHSEKKEKLILGAEMFEADNQLVLNEYLQKLITDKQLKEDSKVWNNFATDYKPLVDFAQKNNLPFIATNIPRRYASMVSKKGVEVLATLGEESKRFIAPLPIEIDLKLPAYANMIAMMGEGHGAGMGNMKPEYFAQAQAVKDATMAHFILKNWQAGKTLIHYNGAYHSDNFESILWYLKKAKPSLKILTISSVEQVDLQTLQKDNLQKANFILAIPESMTKTY
jgi:uncharacterized iron-regulated protein